jgi:hypothetical protein
LIASGVVIDFLPVDRLEVLFIPEFWLALLGVAVTAILAAFMLRWRIAGGEREPALRVPTCGTSPLGDTAALLALVIGIATLASSDATLDRAIEWNDRLHAPTTVFALAMIGVPIWAWLFARPRVVEARALQAGLDRPTPRAWLRATAASFALIVGALVIARLAITADDLAARIVAPVVAPIPALITTAVLLDIIADARAHRAQLVPVAMLHQVQYTGVVERALSEAGIPCHCHSAHLRSLLAFFGPFAPVIVLVPAAHAEAARTRCDEILDVSRTDVPVARVA